MLLVGSFLYGFLYFRLNAGIYAVILDLFLVILVMVLACINIARNDPYLFAKGTVELN